MFTPGFRLLIMSHLRSAGFTSLWFNCFTASSLSSLLVHIQPACSHSCAFRLGAIGVCLLASLFFFFFWPVTKLAAHGCLNQAEVTNVCLQSSLKSSIWAYLPAPPTRSSQECCTTQPSHFTRRSQSRLLSFMGHNGGWS